MLKVLVKKQLMEIFRGYFYNERKGVRRSTAGTIGMFLIFGCLMVFLFGGVSIGAAFVLAEMVLPMHLDWLYFVLMGLASIVIGVFGSVFSTYSTLYLSKDNELLFSLPIPAKHIIFSRLISVFVLVGLYSLFVWVPAQIVYFLFLGFRWSVFIATCLSGICILMIVMMLTCLLGMVVAKVSVKLKNRSFITVLISLGAMGLYYVFYFNAEGVLSNLIQNSISNAYHMHWYTYPFYAFGMGSAGHWGFEAIIIVCVLALTGIVYAAIQNAFFSLALASNIQTSSHKKQISYIQKSQRALLKREWKHFTSSATYMLNTALGSILTPLAVVFFALKTNDALELFQLSDTIGVQKIGAFFVLIICVMTSLNDISAPSISLEGKNMWIIRSLPIDTWDILKAKLRLHVLVTIIPALLAMCIGVWFVNYNVVLSFFMVITPIVYVVFTGLFGLMLNLLMPNLNWTNETTPIKTSMNVFLTILVNMMIPIVMLIVCMHAKTSDVILLTIFTGMFLLSDFILMKWTKTKGVHLFETI